MLESLVGKDSCLLVVVGHTPDGDDGVCTQCGFGMEWEQVTEWLDSSSHGKAVQSM
jgi:hypothetical protein